MRNLFRYVGLRHLKTKPMRTLLTTVGVSLGIALYIAIEIINRSTLASFKESIDAVAGKATLSVSAGESGFSEAKLDIVAQGTAPIARLVIVRQVNRDTPQYVSEMEPGKQNVKLTWIDTAARPGAQYMYYVRVQQTDTKLAWASPVWIHY